MTVDYTWLNNPRDVAERLLLDVAAKIQLSPSQYAQAETNYRALSSWIDEGDHLLSNRVTDIYPSGSFAIGAAILGQVRADQHDVDVVIELDLPLSSDPEIVLKALEEAVKRDPGTRYHALTKRQSRCVTVTYKDKRTIDLMPVVRDWSKPDHVSRLFHFNEEKGESYTKEINPAGFAEHFRRSTLTSASFNKRFVGALSIANKADIQDMPEFEPLYAKAPRVVALQLLKRKRNLRWRKLDRKDRFRKPPSVAQAAMSLDQTYSSDYLIDETIMLAEHIRGEIAYAGQHGDLLSVTNPAWPPDVFTDRWPESLQSQRLFADDLADLADDLKLLRQGVSIAEQSRILSTHFGERVSGHALNSLGEAMSNARKAGRTMASSSGRISILPAAAPSLEKRPPYGGGKP